MVVFRGVRSTVGLAARSCVQGVTPLDLQGQDQVPRSVLEVLITDTNQAQVLSELRECSFDLPSGVSVDQLPSFTDATASAVWSALSEQKGFNLGPIDMRFRLIASIFPVLVSFVYLFPLELNGVVGQTEHTNKQNKQHKKPTKQKHTKQRK